MRLRLFPREESYFDTFEAAADNVVAAATALCELLDHFDDAEAKAKLLVDLEHEGDRLTHEVFTRLNSTFVTPFDREDIYALASQLDDVVDAIEAAADMMVLHRVEEPIEVARTQGHLIHRAATETAGGVRCLRRMERDALQRYFVAINELENEGDRVYRHGRAALYEFTETEHPARFLLTWKDIIEQLEEAVDGLEHVAHTIESIVLKHA